MSLQTNVFENGRWVTRSIDPYRVRAQNMDAARKVESSSSRPSPVKPPSLGLLTKTLVGSPVIKWMIPARIRNQSKNDLLVITADSIAIKEALGNYTLKDICIKTDFDSPIKSARIIGDPRELTRHDIYAYIHKGKNWEHHAANVDLEDSSGNKGALPPHIAVLALGSQKLVFLCAIDRTPEGPIWLSSHKELPPAESPLRRLGEHIAVDPKSRMIAVAAHEEYVYLYAMKSMSQLREEFKKEAGFEPIKEEMRLPGFPEGAFVLKMEFLHPPLNDLDQIILLLIVSKQGKSSMMWYEWDSGMRLRQSQPKANSIALPSDEQLPLLLIPLKLNCAAFMIICEKRTTLYRDILTGSPIRYVQHIDDVKDPEEPGSSGRQPVWVQWARPMRTPKGSRIIRFDDAIYLCREDGIVQYLTFYSTIDHMLDSTHPAGRMGVNVNTAFAILDVGPGTNDMLAAGGEMSEGGLWYCRARADPTRVSVIPNWTPLNDLAAVVNPCASLLSTETNPRTQNVVGAPNRIFACTGRGRHGAISELRYGTKALKKSAMVRLDDDMDKGVLGIWAFHGYYGEAGRQKEQGQQARDATYVLVSYPTRTLLLRIQLVEKLKTAPQTHDERMHLEQEPQLVTVDTGIDYNARTITSATMPCGNLIQVTENSIRTTRLPVQLQDCNIETSDDSEPEVKTPTPTEPQVRKVHRYDENSCVVDASIHTFQDGSRDDTVSNDVYILLALRTSGNLNLHLGRFADGYQLVAGILLPTQPVCVLLENVCDYLLAIVTTVCGRILIYAVDRSRGKMEDKCHFSFKGEFAICDSVAVISSIRKDETHIESLVVCGLRNGMVVILRLTNRPWELLFHEQLAVGHTSVTVTPDSNVQSRAVMNCENLFCALEYPRGIKPPATVSNILISDDDHPLLQTGSLSAVTQAVSSWVSGNTLGFLAGSFFCLDGKRLHTVSLEPKSPRQMVPRRMNIQGNPVRIIHSTHLNKFIVICNTMTETKERLDNTPSKRSICPSILFLDLDKVSDINSDPGPIDITYESYTNIKESLTPAKLREGERFMGIIEWFPRVEDKEYHILVVYTMLTKSDKPIGRLLFFAITPGDNETPILKYKGNIKLDAPVYSVAVYGEKSLVYCCGKSLWMHTLAVAGPSSYKWLPHLKAVMRSPGRFLTVVEPFIYISSTKESLAVFRYENDSLAYQYGDQTVRDGLHHVHTKEHSLVLASDMCNRVVGLWKPPERRIDNTMPTVFEAILPASITRLRYVNRPIWQQVSSGAATSTALIGSSTDGTITQFAILGKGWRLLRFIQNMAERNPLICPYSRPPRKRHIEPSIAKATDMHINGDILQRVIDRGGETLLREMLDVEPFAGDNTDFESAEARWVRFKELSEEIVAITDIKRRVEEVGDVQEEEWATQCVTKTMAWVRYQLRSAL